MLIYFLFFNFFLLTVLLKNSPEKEKKRRTFLFPWKEMLKNAKASPDQLGGPPKGSELRPDIKSTKPRCPTRPEDRPRHRRPQIWRNRVARGAAVLQRGLGAHPAVHLQHPAETEIAEKAPETRKWTTVILVMIPRFATKSFTNWFTKLLLQVFTEKPPFFLRCVFSIIFFPFYVFWVTL